MISLAARYRPQTFAELVGQETIRSVLSRAAAEDRAAPAYLFSGTRGVGKTTLARVFAKTLNCAKAPTPEPCNVCDQCRKITQGIHVDVPEIDGASNRGIEDARRLRENIGYAPLEARRKIFIIDEAHMLTRESFNALLKTLEEPPPRVTFILATTEAHKFPVTIVSRCQHFIFQRLPEAQIAAHLISVLQRENLRYEENAVRMLARRAAGSVRDAMSLTDQTLALGGEILSASGTRQVLGLAGREFFTELLRALANGDCAAVAGLTCTLLDQGVDIGFFLRELAALWRNLFLIRQTGDGILPALELSEEENREFPGTARFFPPAHIHAAWQMTLDAQRRVTQSIEPAGALELFLLNLALLPRLVPVERVPAPHVADTPAPPRETGTAHKAADAETPQAASATPETPTPRDWPNFLTFCEERRSAFPDLPLPLLRQAQGCFEGQNLHLLNPTPTLHRILNNGNVPAALRTLLREYCGGTLVLDLPVANGKSKTELKAEMSAHPLLQPLMKQFNAQLIDCAPSAEDGTASEEKKS